MGTISPFFDGLDDEDRRRIHASCKRQRFAAGAYVFHQGEAGASVHFIASGKVAVLAGGGMGEPVMLRVMRTGEAFGEQALLSVEHRRTATIQAITTTETMALHRDDFEDLRRCSPAVDRLLISLLAMRVDDLTHQIVELVDVPAPVRIYRRLLLLGEVFEVLGSAHPIPVTQSQLAALAGVRLRITNQVIRKACDDGVLVTARRRIGVENWVEVRRRAGVGAA